MFGPPTTYNQESKGNQKAKRKDYQPVKKNPKKMNVQVDQINLDDIQLPDDV